jgi:hypothetical protein
MRTGKKIPPDLLRERSIKESAGAIAQGQPCPATFGISRQVSC